MDIDAVYEAIAAGTDRDPDLSWTRRRLQAQALARAKEGTDDERLGALRVAAVLGPRDGIPVVAELVRDPDPRVRAWAVSQAVGARELGIGPLRTALEGPDPEQVRVALDHLLRWVDAGCVPALRRLLQSPDAGVRARAARLLGNTGGASVRGDLQRLAQDASDDVRAAAAEALDTLAGARPKAVRDPWWDEAAPAEGAAPTPPPEAGVLVDPAAPPQWAADAVRWGANPTERARPEVADAAAPVWDGHAVPLPAGLPTETRALARLVGMVADGDRAAVFAVFRQADAKKRREEFGALLLAYSGSDPALGRGLCLLAGELGGPAHVTGLRPLLRDGHVLVRAEALRALGRLAPPAAIPWTAPFLDDPTVREAAVEALVGIGRRGRAELARDALRRVRTEDQAFRAVVDAAVADLAAAP